MRVDTVVIYIILLLEAVLGPQPKTDYIICCGTGFGPEQHQLRPRLILTPPFFPLLSLPPSTNQPINQPHLWVFPSASRPRLSPPPSLSTMKFVMLIALLVAAFALLCIRVPSVWFALMAIDEPSDVRELGLVVASRTSCHHSLSFPPPHGRSDPPITLIYREPFPRKWSASMHGQAHHDASQSTQRSIPHTLPYSSPRRPSHS